MNVGRTAAAQLEVKGEGRCAALKGDLVFDTVADLLAPGSAAILGGRMAVVDLTEVRLSDSSGLALLIEWLSVARGASQPLRYEHMPSQLQQLARLSDVEELLQPG